MLCVLQVPLHAQERNTFVHTIQRGETVYSIARTYQVSPDAILQLNPSATDGIKAGSTLIIPQQAPKERFHTIKAGETLYQLTKTYGVDAETICKANPGLTADNFKAGSVIRIPAEALATATATSTPAVQKPQPDTRPECREMYRVGRRETLYSIARQFKLTEKELQDANPEMKQPGYKLRKGDLICIPYPKRTKEEPTAPVKAGNQTPSNAELIGGKTTPAPKRLVRIGVLLPFKGGTEENKKMIEFYRGVLMAVEQAKASGISVDVFAYDSGHGPSALANAVADGGLDFVIGPLQTEQTGALSDFCERHGTRLVVPFSSQGESVYQNPRYYTVTPPRPVLISEAAHLAAGLFAGENFILLDGRESDPEATAFTEALNRKLTQKGRRMATLRIDARELEWIETLDPARVNVIVPGSSGITLLDRLCPLLRNFAEKYPRFRIRLLGYPEWQTYTARHLEDFHTFDAYAYSNFYANPLGQGPAARFEAGYRKKFHEPLLGSFPSFGMLGFDTAAFFLKGIAEFGDSFEQHLAQVEAEHCQHRFDFRRVSYWGGFINRGVELIHYTPAHTIELVRPK